MTPQRKAGAPRLVEWTGERCVPWAPDAQVVYEHLHRYLWAARIVQGRSVLDLGSGEGFGAAIVAETADTVVGVDIDPRTVEHSELNYARPGLTFEVGTATDLSRFEAGTFGAVIAFETIEHLAEQEQVLDEIARVLSDDGLLVISTPDRRKYTEASGNTNPFHVRELSADEFTSLLRERFSHLSVWGQCTITGSHIASVDLGDNGMASPAVDFYVERAGEDWRVAPAPSPMYLLGVASRAPLAAIAELSTLADPELELVRIQQRQLALVRTSSETEIRSLSELAAAREAARAKQESELAEVLRDRDRLGAELQQRIAVLEGDLQSSRAQTDALSSELAVVREANRLFEQSVTIKFVRRASDRVYRAIGGRHSLPARMIQGTLRTLGR